MNLPIFAINLDRETGRWSELCASAEAAGLTLQRIAAVDGRALAEKDWTEIDLPAARKLSGRDILSGEYACYRSHIRALETFLAVGSAHGLIVEDDVLFSKNTMRRIEAIIAAVPDFDVIKLTNHRMSFFMRAVETVEGDEIGRALHGPQGSAAAYLVTRKGAQGLLSALAVMKMPWDVALERFWDTGLKVYSVRQNVLGFAASSGISGIAGPSGSYKSARLGGPSRLRAGVLRASDELRRLHHVLLPPPLPRNALDDAKDNAPRHTLLLLLAALAILALVSAVWREADTYRYAGLALALVAVIRWFRVDLWTYSKPLIGWVGFLCLGWSLYVFIRLAIVYFGTHQLGGAEGIYMFPLFYATTGFAFLLFVRQPARLVLWFMILSLVFLAADTFYSDMFQGIQPAPWLFNNPIHASVAAGFIFLCTLQFMAYSAQRTDLGKATKNLHWALSTAVLLLALVNIIEMRSKGVWLALALALLLLAVMTLARGHRRELLVSGGVLVIVAAGIVAAHNIFSSTADDTMAFVKTLVPDVFRHGVLPAFDRAIASDAVPLAAKERLMLWADAINIWKRHPIFGASSSWLTEWQNRTYHPMIFNVFHNGYLEIAVRYGVVGLAFFAFLYTWSARQVLLAMRAKLVAPAAWSCYISTLVFFALTILTNSNNRLAMGEAFMWFAAAFGFYCFYVRQQKNLVAPRTYF
ncbi:glycosyl transferase family 2 [Mesorhizobium sp. M7A.T.Ca.US.000.02.1.1]|nr:glycosyl transferase family 2 [Mesorhizobium sp. M7A.T.Ca.US.000.02.1.1]RUT90964.1 glycosyl transferase family 2 [Mesorhizobium sp. M7A.T.Ca.US.000.02.2.1]RUU84412.1 glycosyl transferase family 2 [Mesorhizobium sp. M7A.T.Ca.TU.009.01.1.2]